MTILASQIAAAVANDVLDASYNRFSPTVHLGWINDAQRTLASLKPDASTAKRNLQLVAGVYQSLSADAFALVRPIRNMGVGGATPGARVEMADYDHFTRQNPSWMSATTAAAVQVVMIDEQDDRHFYNYPPQPSGLGAQGVIEVVESIIPAVIAAIGDAISLHDVWEPAIYQFCMAKAYRRSSSPISQAKSTEFMNAFYSAVGRKDMIEKASSANRKVEKEQGKVTNAG